VSKRTNRIKNEEGRPMVATTFRRSYSNNVAEIMDAEDPLFTLHFRINRKTKGMFTTAGYMVQTATFKNVFNYEEMMFIGVRPILVG
jgi:acetyl-CoA synthetase